jgi:hypothetical protein
VLPFSKVLSPAVVERAFADRHALFAQDDVFSTPIVLWAFLAQMLRDGKEQVAGLYGYRWNSELDIRDIKQILRLDHARCKTPKMVHRELWVKLLGYNLIRKVIATAATHDKQPPQLGFTLACQTILSSWMMLATDSCRDVEALCKSALKRIAANQVANRPGRIEPRALKRRRHRYPLMTRPSQELRTELRET